MGKRTREYDELDESTEVCGAKKKHNRGRCKALPVPGRTRCRFHGGNSLRGIAHPNFQGKGYSKDAPAQLAASIDALVLNPNLASVAEELAVMQGRLKELIGRLKQNEYGEAWRKYRVKLRKLGVELAKDSPDTRKLSDLHVEMEMIMEDAIADERTWSQITSTVATLSKLADTERKRDETLAKTVTEKQLFFTFSSLARTAAELLTWSPGPPEGAKVCEVCGAPECKTLRTKFAERLKAYLVAARSRSPETQADIEELSNG